MAIKPPPRLSSSRATPGGEDAARATSDVVEVRLVREQLVELAGLVADALEERGSASAASLGLVDAAAVAARYGVTRDFVYRHAGELGGVRLGDGPRARLRFDLDEAGRRLAACTVGRGAPEAAAGVVEPIRHRRRRTGSGTSGDLLPVRGSQ